MSDPKLRIKASGYEGSGYAIPTWLDANDKPTKVPGVTTVLNVLDKPAIKQWTVNQTVAYAIANLDTLQGKDDDQRRRFLQWFHARKPDFDNPEIDIYNYHVGVLDDAAELGTLVHEWTEAYWLDEFEPEVTRPEQAQMVTEFIDWANGQEIEVLFVEKTFVSKKHGFAGTADIILRIKINGKWVVLLIDTKTSRHIWETHMAQIAALSMCDTMMTEVEKGQGVEYTATQDGVKSTSYWVEDKMPEFEGFAILHIRPDDLDKDGNEVPAYCKLEIIPNWKIEAHEDIFLGALTTAKARNKLKSLEKEHKNDF